MSAIQTRITDDRGDYYTHFIEPCIPGFHFKDILMPAPIFRMSVNLTELVFPRKLINYASVVPNS